MTTSDYDIVLRRLSYTRLRDVIRGRWDGRLDWEHVIASADLPAELSHAVRNVVRISRLWKGEKVDVAAELIAHFQDGLAAGQSPDALLASFGDQQAAAKLIRRAKRRNRPLVWRLWRYGWMSLIAIIFLYIAAGLWQALGRPTVSVDYLAILNKAPRAIAEDERAWPHYRDAMLAMGFAPNPRDLASPDKMGFWPGHAPLDLDEIAAKPGHPNWEQTKTFLSEHADSIAALRSAAGRAGLGFVSSASMADLSETDRKLFGIQLTPEQIEAARQETYEDRWLISTLLPNLQQLRAAALLLAADALRAAEKGDGDTAYADVVAIINLGRHCEETPFLVSLLVAENAQREARGVIRDVLASNADVWSDGQLRDLAHKLATSRVDWNRSFDGDAMSFYDTMQRLYTDNGDGDGRLAFRTHDRENVLQKIETVLTGLAGNSAYKLAFSDSKLALLALPAANLTIASRKEMIDKYEELAARARKRLETPLWKQGNEPTVESELTALERGPLGKYRYLFLNLLMPSYEGLQITVASSDGERDGVFLGIALELYRREHKKWPAKLAELSPRWLPELPVDRINGGPLGFRIVENRPVVYSLGVDRDDDQGRLPAECEGDPLKFRVSRPYEIPAETTEFVRGWHDGDWVIWSTVPKHSATENTETTEN